jgi:putative hydrolase of HD superfamily
MKSEFDVLLQQLNFLTEIDRLKTVVRQSPLLDRSRKENSAEHSWHLALYALLLQQYAHEPIDAARVIQMLLIHDVVEIDAGDAPIHGESNREEQIEREILAAQRLFGLLPSIQDANMENLWREFETGQTADAKFAKALDRFQPLLVNIMTGGGTWVESAVTYEQVLERYRPAIEGGAPLLWRICEQWLDRHFMRESRSDR